MKKLKKGIVIFLILILFLPFIFGQQVVEVQKQETKKNFLTAPLEMLKSPLLWGIILFLVVLILIVIGLVFLIKWLVQYVKLRNDIFYKLKSERLKLAKIHRRYNSNHWWKVEKNIPIRLVRKTEGKISISQPIAYHRGDFKSSEGNLIISMNLAGYKKFFVFPVISLLIIPNQEEIEIKTIKNKFEILKLPKAEEIIQFNESEILLFCEGISNTGMFYIPVLKSKEGKIIDISLPIFQSLKSVVLGDYLYEQTDEFSKLAKKSMDINPNLRYATKLSDSSNTVELPSSEKK